MKIHKYFRHKMLCKYLDIDIDTYTQKYLTHTKQCLRNDNISGLKSALNLPV